MSLPPPLEQLRLRLQPAQRALLAKAMSFALDRQRFVDTILAGKSEAWYQPAAKNSRGTPIVKGRNGSSSAAV